MSILINKSTRLLVQGITGRDGHFHAAKMKEYGTHVVGGTSPGKGGSTVDGLPVFNTMYEAVEKTQANASIIFVPRQPCGRCHHGSCRCRNQTDYLYLRRHPYSGRDQGLPLHPTKGSNADRSQLPRFNFTGEKSGGYSSRQCFQKGNIGVISRSGTLTYEIVYHLTVNGMGQSTAIGMGGDPVVGLYFS